MRSFCRKTHVHKIPRFGGGGGVWGGGEVPILFYGREDFSDLSPPKRDSQEGVQFGSPETIRENQTIRANLWIDSHESGHLCFRQLNSESQVLGQQKGVTSICSDFPVSFPFVPIAFRLFWNLFRFLPNCFQNKWENQGSPLLPTLASQKSAIEEKSLRFQIAKCRIAGFCRRNRKKSPEKCRNKNRKIARAIYWARKKSQRFCIFKIAAFSGR